GLLPSFPSNDELEKRETLRRLFSGENFKFGNPLEEMHRKLKEGYLHPEIACYRKQTRQFRYRDYKMRHQSYLSELLTHLLLARQELFEHASTLAPGEPLKFKYRPPPKKKSTPLEQTVKKKVFRILKEVREECGVPDTSSDEDEETSPVQRSRRQLFKSLGPIPSPEPTLPSVVSTFATKPQMVNGDLGHNDHSLDMSQPGQMAANSKRPRPISPVEVTEESYKLMLKLHKKKKNLESDMPELDTSNITLQDILTRCRANKKNTKINAAGDLNGEITTGDPSPVKKKLKMKTKGEKKRKLKGKESPTVVDEDSSVAPPAISSVVEQNSSVLGEEEESQEPSKTVFGPATNFFCLLRDILSEFPDGKTSTFKVEDRVTEWLDLNDEISNPWLALQKNWVELVTSALKFLSGNELGLRVENFVPFVDYKERAQQWNWIGVGRDSDPELTSLFRYWLQHKDEVNVDGIDTVQGSPPPPKAKTNFIVRPTSNNEKALFREQERRRFAAPHKAYTFMMHGYDSVVGPVKGVYDKDSGTNKAREHNLLVSDRPPFVTILTLVRDAAARLPNGEGTRGDICELLKDSQFLAPAVTETQINAVVSGALDRLHSEKDPCVKYDVSRKLWIYLHRNRTEDEFERIHQAQAAAVKAKKTLTRPKTSKVVKDSPSQPSTTPVTQLTPALTPSKSPVTLSTLPSPAPPPAKSVTPEPASLLTGKLGKAPAPLVQTSLPGSTVSSTSLSPTIAQLRATQAAMSKSAATPLGKQTIKQLTSTQNLTASATTNVTTSVLTVTSVGLNVTSSLAAQLLYSPGLSQSALSAGKIQKTGCTPVTTAATFSLVTTMNASQAQSNQIRPSTIPTISMLPSHQLLKQQQQQQQAASQSVLKQNAALVAAVGQTVAANANSATLGKSTPTVPKQTFTMTARQTPPPNMAISKNQISVPSSKPATGLKQTSLMLSQEGIASLTSAANHSGGKFVALTSVAGMTGAEGTVMAQLMQQAAAVHSGGPRAAPRAIRLPGGNIVQPMIGGNHIQLGGKPLAHAKGLVQLTAGKGGPTLGLIRTSQGPLTAINLIPQQALSSMSVSAAGGKTTTILSPAITSAAAPTATTSTVVVTHPTQFASAASKATTQAKILSPVQAGLVVTQLAQGNITLRPAPGTPGTQTKVMPTGQASLVPTQFILQPAPGSVSGSQSSGTPIIVSSSSGGKGAQNIQQVMRTVLTQQGSLKPGQAAILISQPQTAASSVAGLTAAQVMQAGGKTPGRGSPKGKVQPVYARIITPPPGMMKLANMTQMPTVSGAPGNVSVIQTMGKLLVTSGIATHSLPSLPLVSLAVPPSAIINPVATATREEVVAASKAPGAVELIKKEGSSDS
ncbi:unnamed protein product, partial [Candidula unifasciata]